MLLAENDEIVNATPFCISVRRRSVSFTHCLLTHIHSQERLARSSSSSSILANCQSL